MRTLLVLALIIAAIMLLLATVLGYVVGLVLLVKFLLGRRGSETGPRGSRN
jgi:hypothetical protein